MRTAIGNALGDKQIAAFEKVVDQNAANVEFWSRFCDFAPPPIPQDAAEKLRNLREATFRLLDRKIAAPLDDIVPDATFTDAMQTIESLARHVAAYNQAVTDANTVISAKKAATEASDVETVESALAQLILTKTRYRQDVAVACDEYHTAQQEKKKLEEKKTSVRKQLDDYTKTVIKKYERTINTLLQDFHAGFSITETKSAYLGGVASSTYRILINQTPVELGDEKTPLDTPSFRNTLSAGDKSTLALAFSRAIAGGSRQGFKNRHIR
jgi:wobble nucleotide-excising tRNase